MHNDQQLAQEDPIFQELVEMIAEFFEGFGFKPNLGRLWAALFYSTAPRSQRELAQLLDRSAGLVSQGLAVLVQYEMVTQERKPDTREVLYRCNKNLLQIVSSILKRREQRVIQQLEQRIETLHARLATQSDPSPEVKIRLQRFEEILVICQLASSIIEMVDRFSSYSYQAVALGARTLAHLRVNQLPDLLKFFRR